MPAAADNDPQRSPIDGLEPWRLMLSVGLVAGAVIALQIAVMRVFAVGSWAHFGSFVVSLAMLGFGLISAVMCIAKDWFDRNWRLAAGLALVAFGPLAVLAQLIAQQVPFNAIFIISDPGQKWRLAANFLLYLLPFLAGATFLGTVFLKAREGFNRVYFADLAGSGAAGFVVLLSMYAVRPADMVTVPLVLWALGAGLWILAIGSHWQKVALAVAVIGAFWLHASAEQLGLTRLAVSDYKGTSYARKFVDSQRLYERTSPFGYLEVFSSSYLHFAPGLSDNAGFNLPEMPANAYLGLYLDGDGPSGVIRKLPATQEAYFRYLPMYYPYVVKQAPDCFVVQFGGGISTAVALAAGARTVTVAEANPMVLDAFRGAPVLREFTGDMLHDPRVGSLDEEGRLALARSGRRYDVIDLSLADSAGLSSPGGFAIVEKYAYTREAMLTYMRALADGGVLSVTLWNKEEPPKSVMKLYATLAAAARELETGDIGDDFFVASSYLSTATVLYKRGGFTPAEVTALREHTRAMSFDEIYSPGLAYDTSGAKALLAGFRSQLLPPEEGDAAAPGTSEPSSPETPAPAAPAAAAPAGEGEAAGSPDASDISVPTGGEPVESPEGADASESAVGTESGGVAEVAESAESAVTDGGSDTGPETVPATELGKLFWQRLVLGGSEQVADGYVFDVRPLTNDRPYFAAYVRPADLPKVTERLDLIQDEWGYLLIWATLAVACLAALVLVLIPVLFGWRTIFSRYPGKLGTILYFACLGAGYIMVEVGLINSFVQVLSNATVSASVLITGMLVCSGIGSLHSERWRASAITVMPVVFAAIGAILIVYGLWLDRVLDLIGLLPYGLRLLVCFALILPPAYLMGMPMPSAMAALASLRKDHMFLWAWGINGSFSVVGAALVPILATAYGISSVLVLAGAAYLVALPAFFSVLKRPGRVVGGGPVGYWL